MQIPDRKRDFPRIDAHQHFWEISRFEYPWMPPAPSKLRRNVLPADLESILWRNRFDGSVVVQATTTLAETRWLLELATEYKFLRGVVGWVDLTDPGLPATLDELQRNPKFRGVRHPAHDEPDANWLVREDVIRGLRELARRRLPFDLLIRPEHLHLAPRLADLVPDLRMVIDHIAKPRIREGVMEPWARDLERAAQIPQCYVKLSGMITEADWKAWKAADLRPFLQHALNVFTPDRAMFGSDWPMCWLAGSWKEVLAAFTQAFSPQTDIVREKVLGATAIQFYGLEV